MNDATEQASRPQYYDGQYLGADDIEAAVRYARIARARHTLGAHLWGIAIGFDIVERPLSGTDVELLLTPGVAWDGYGRILVAPAPQRLGLELATSVQGDTDTDGIPLEIWIAYRELPARPPGVGFGCPDDDSYGRVVETYRIEVRRRSPNAENYSVTIANRSLDARKALQAFDSSKQPLYDESVPEQTFPERGDRDRWSIFIGVARWRKDTGQPGRWIQRTLDDRMDSRKRRVYIGAVAETIVAADGVLRLRDRSKDPDDPIVNYTPPTLPGPSGPPPINDLVWCEGNLRVVGDARLQGGKLDYRAAKGGDDGVPIHLRRTSVNGSAPKTTLDAFIGPPSPLGPPNAQTRFTVSSNDAANNPTELLTVVTDGRIGINIAEPSAALHVHSENSLQGDVRLFSPSADFEYDCGTDKLFVFRGTVAAEPDGSAGGATAFMGTKLGVGSTQPRNPLAVRCTGPSQESISFEAPDGATRWHINQNLDGTRPGLNFVETNVKDGRLFLAAGGNTGIGTTLPKTALHVEGDRIRLGDDNKRIDLRTDGGAVDLHSETHELYIRSSGTGGQNNVVINPFSGDGNVGIGTTNPVAKLDVDGDMRLNGDAFSTNLFGFWTTSDRREKVGIQALDGALAKLLELRGVSFRWREPARHGGSAGVHLGFVAQDVEGVFPEWVRETPWGTKAVNTAGLSALSVEAMRELSARCDRLEAELSELRSQLASGAQGDRPAPRGRGSTIPPKSSRPKASRKHER